MNISEICRLMKVKINSAQSELDQKEGVVLAINNGGVLVEIKTSLIWELDDYKTTLWVRPELLSRVVEEIKEIDWGKAPAVEFKVTPRKFELRELE